MLHSPNPLLDERYAALDKQLSEYAAASIPAEPDDDPEEATRRFVASLGAARITACLDATDADALDSVTLCRTRELLAYYSALCDTGFAMQGLGSYPILLSGSSTLCKTYVGPAARGEKIAAFAVTEPEAGSDVSAIQTLAVRDSDGYVINGRKTLISNAGIADFYVVFARHEEAFLALVVDAEADGIRFPNPMEVIAPHPIGDVAFANCRVPAAQVLGDGTDGFAIAMATLDRFRATVGAAALGLAERAFDEAVAHTKIRRQFGKQLCNMPTVRATIAEMATEIEAARMLVYRAAVLANAADPAATLAASTAKLFATEAAQRVVDQAVQLHGGSGVVRGSVVERLYREVRPLRLYEGTSEIQKAIIAKNILKEKESETTDAGA